MKYLYFLLFSLIFNSLLAQNITEYTLPPAPIFKCGDAPAKLNQVLYGATPPNSAQNPVVVFVHGWFDNGYSWFMAKNQWYHNLYNKNIRTAFLFQSQSGSFQDNGKIVANMIRKVCLHYNTNKVIAVCHSKGGFDIEWAMYNYGIEDSVSNVITLSTPYWGAPIVDLISNPIIRLVTENIPIVGPIFKGAGTYQMQAAYMAGVVRPMMDNHPKNKPDKFRCFASWGYLHPTELPNNIPDDILKVVFYDSYRPLCIDIPGLGSIGGGLMNVFMAATGLVTASISIQASYQNPSKNTYMNDGLAPYYSSIRPGAIEISERPNAASNNLNHIDVLLSKYTWNVVNNELEDIMSNSNRNSKLSASNVRINTNEPIVNSSMQWIDGADFNFTIKNNKNASIMLLGNYDNLQAKIFNSKGELIKTEIVNNQAMQLWEIFKILNINSLESDEYTVKFSKPIKAIVLDENDAKLELSIIDDKIIVQAENWHVLHDDIAIKVQLNRNIDENGLVIWDKIIPVDLKYSIENQRFESEKLTNLETGNYNVSAYATTKKLKRFATTSYYFNSKNVEDSDIKIYPNFVKDDFVLTWKNDEPVQNIFIYDVHGRLMYQIEIDKQMEEQQIKLSARKMNLNSGMYIVKINQHSAKILVAE
jgi:pimeloyl-ACP methyl ester carboxylesterase